MTLTVESISLYGLGIVSEVRMKTKAHRGFKVVQAEIAKKQGISMDSAGAILATSARKASPAAKAKNPRLKKVLGKAK